MNSRIHILSLLLVLAAGSALWAQTSADQPRARLAAGTGFDYSRGDYGLAADTEVFSIPANFSYETDRWLLRATVPWLTIRGPATVVGGTAGAGVRPDAGESSGLGDTYLGATYRAGEVFAGWAMDVSARLKLPTGDEARGLGTGEADYYAQADLRRTFGAVTPFASFGYRVLGDNARYQLRDGAYAGGGAFYRASDATVLGASLDWRQRLEVGAEHATELTAFVTHDLSPRWQLIAYGLKGFTRGSPDIGAGAHLNYRF